MLKQVNFNNQGMGRNSLLNGAAGQANTYDQFSKL